MEREKIKTEITIRIWELKRRIDIWNFVFGKNSSESKVYEFNRYFTNWISFELQEGLETKILMDLRKLLDKRSTISMYKIFKQTKLKNVQAAYEDIRKFINNKVAHENHNAEYSYTFKNIHNTLTELQKLIDEDDKEAYTQWDVSKFTSHDLDRLYEKVRRVNEWEDKK